jgi:hypothetical protein
MSVKIMAIPAILVAAMFSFSAASGAQPMDAIQTLSARQQAIVPIAAFIATGDLERLRPALHEGLNAGLTVNEI